MKLGKIWGKIKINQNNLEKWNENQPIIFSIDVKQNWNDRNTNVCDRKTSDKRILSYPNQIRLAEIFDQ